MKPTRWSPFMDLEHMQRNMNRVFGTDLLLPNGEFPTIAPTDIYKHKNTLHIDVQLPKFSKEEITVEQEGRVIRISAEHSVKSTDKKDYLLQETSEYLHRTFSIPKEADDQHIKTVFKNGVLKFEMPLLHLKPPKTLEIQ